MKVLSLVKDLCSVLQLHYLTPVGEFQPGSLGELLFDGQVEVGKFQRYFLVLFT